MVKEIFAISRFSLVVQVFETTADAIKAFSLALRTQRC